MLQNSDDQIHGDKILNKNQYWKAEKQPERVSLMLYNGNLPTKESIARDATNRLLEFC